MQATPRFATLFPLLKAVALAGAPQSKATQAVARELLPLALAAAGEAGVHRGVGVQFRVGFCIVEHGCQWRAHKRILHPKESIRGPSLPCCVMLQGPHSSETRHACW